MTDPVAIACPDDKVLTDYLSGMLDGEREAEIDRHVEACPACSQRVATTPTEEELGNLAVACRREPDEASLKSLIGKVLSKTHVPIKASGASVDEVPVRTWEPHTSSGYPEIPGYRVLSEIHRGGQGVVYKALQVATKRTVALKVPREGPFASEASRGRFEREIALAAQLLHPNIVRILESGVAHGHQYFAMDFIAGEALDKWLAGQRQITVQDRLRLFESICRTVHYAHLRGVIHRDLKPSNIMVTPDGQPRILDFGLAKSAIPEAFTGERRDELTLTGQVMGTLPYLSPEQASGATDPDIRSDIYSLGVMLYEILTQRLPYPVDGTAADTIKHIRQTAPARPSTIARFLDADLDAIVLRCLEKSKDSRYQSAGGLADDLNRYLNGELIEAREASVGYLTRKILHRYWMQSVGIVVLVVLAAIATVSVHVAVTFTVVLTLMALSLIVVWQWRREQQERRRAEENAKVAGAARENERQALLNEKMQRQLAENELHVNWVQQGRLLVRQGDLAAADEILWREHLQTPDLLTYWALWQRYATHPEWTRLLHERELQAIAFSPDGQKLFTAGLDYGIHTWQTSTSRELSTWYGHDAEIVSMAVSPNGVWLASGDAGGRINLWDIAAGRARRVFAKHRTAVTDLKFTRNGEVLMSAGLDGELISWPLNEAEEPLHLNLKQGPIYGMDITQDGELIALGMKGFISLLDTTENRLLGVLRGHAGAVRSVAFSPTSYQLASASFDRTVRLWDMHRMTERRTFHGHVAKVHKAVFSTDGKTLATAGDDMVIRLWNVADMTLEAVLAGHTKMIRALAFSPGGQWLVSAGHDREVRWWPIRRGQETRHLTNARYVSESAGLRDILAKTLIVDPIEFSDEGALLTIRESTTIHNCINNTPFAELPEPVGDRVFISRDAQTVAWHQDERTIRVIRPFEPGDPVVLEGSEDPIIGLWFLPDQQTIATVGADKAIRLWDIGSGRQFAQFDHDESVLAVACSPDGRILASGGQDSRVNLWDVPAKVHSYSLYGHEGYVLWLTFSHSGRLLASGGLDATVRVWDCDAGKCVAVLRGHRDAVLALAFSHDDRLLASGGPDGTLRLWDLRQQIEVANFEIGHSVGGLSFAPSGNELAYTTPEGIRLIDLRYYDSYLNAHRERFARRFGSPQAPIAPARTRSDLSFG